MQRESEIIISDTSCLILLTKIGELDVLQKLSKNIFITPEINIEFGNTLPSWIKIKQASNCHFQALLENELDKGEASAIALSLDFYKPIYSYFR